MRLLYSLCLVISSTLSSLITEAQPKKYNIKQVQRSYKPILDMFFGGGFDNDTISLRIGSFKIFNNIIVNNFSIVDHTNFKVVMYTLDSSKNEMGVIYLGSTQFGINTSHLKTGKLKDPNGIIYISIGLNGHEKTYSLDLRKGIYIDFNKSSDSLDYVQRNKRMLYD